MFKISDEKDFVSGLLFLVVGGFFLWSGSDYQFGTVSHMGPGFFPRVLAILVSVVGLILCIQGSFAPERRIGGIAFKPLLLVTASILCFSFLVRPAGLVISLVLTILVSAAASAKFRLDWKASAGLVALVVLCKLVFLDGLGLNIPAFGPWLAHLLPWSAA